MTPPEAVKKKTEETGQLLKGRKQPATWFHAWFSVHCCFAIACQLFFPPPAVRVLLSLRALPGRGMSSADSRNKKFVVLACLRTLRIARSRRDLAIPLLERLQFRVLAMRVCTFA